MKAEILAASLDLSDPDFENQLIALRPDIIVHTAGPYQGQDYRVAKALKVTMSIWLMEERL